MQKYVIALYIRLSLEDYKYDSMSIENQHLTLNEFVASMPESANAEVLEFIDNGHMIDRNGVLLKIDSAPLQPNDLAAPQAVKRPQQHRKFQLCSCNSFKEFIQFLFVIEATVELILLGSLNFIRRVGRDHVIFDSVLERLMDICVIVDHRRGFYPL